MRKNEKKTRKRMNMERKKEKEKNETKPLDVRYWCAVCHFSRRANDRLQLPSLKRKRFILRQLSDCVKTESIHYYLVIIYDVVFELIKNPNPDQSLQINLSVYYSSVARLRRRTETRTHAPYKWECNTHTHNRIISHRKIDDALKIFNWYASTPWCVSHMQSMMKMIQL